VSIVIAANAGPVVTVPPSLAGCFLTGNRRAVLIRGEKRDNKSQQAEATGP
jgi:hypothetical protein